MRYVFSYIKMFRRERRPGDLVFACGFLIVALALAVALPTQARFLGNKDLVAEPGFWPLVGVVMMVVFGAIHFVGTLNAPRLAGRGKEVILWLRSLEFVGWFFVYVMVVPVIGYLPASVIFALLLCLRLGYRSFAVLAIACIFAVAVVLVFKAGLGVRIPGGAIYQYLPEGLRTFFVVNL